MSYLVLARKYRPMSFDEVVGQNHVTTTLKNAIENNRIANAYLFTGPRGVGKTSIARILAKAINCEQGPILTPCNTCSFCKEITESRSLDVLEIDGASNRGIDEVRNLRESLRYAPTPGKYKIYIIDEVHMLTTEAFNALLKTLEEPPKRVLFIFATTEPRRVPPTILSRCQRFDFKRISAKDIIADLAEICSKENISISEEALRIIAQKADGSMRDGQSILDQLIAYAGHNITTDQVTDILGIIDQELLFTCSEHIVNKDVNAVLQLAETVFSEGYDFGEFLIGLAEHFRNILVVKSTGNAEIIDVSKTLLERYRAASNNFEFEDLFRLIKIASDHGYGLQRAENPRLSFEIALIKLVKMDSTIQITELIENLKKKSTNNGVGDLFHETYKNTSEQVNIAGQTQLSERSNAIPTVDPPSKTQSDTAEVDLKSIRDQWEKIVDEVKRKKIALGFLLNEGLPTKIHAKTVEVTFRKGNGFHMSSVERGRDVIEEVIAQLVGVKLRIHCIPDEQGILGEAKSHNPKGEQKRAFEKLLSDSPIVKNIVDKFDAEFLE